MHYLFYSVNRRAVQAVGNYHDRNARAEENSASPKRTDNQILKERKMRHQTTTGFLFLACCSSVSSAEQPNFVVVMGDDVGWDAFGCAGTETARTPNIDRLAKQSCYMTRFYCSVSQCAPLRAELYTGLYPGHNGVLANARKASRPGVKNIVDHLVPLGYCVGLTGKLHFGLGKQRFEKIEGFPSGANSSNADYSLDGVRNFIEESRAQKTPFCVFICSIHAHHPWDLSLIHI